MLSVEASRTISPIDGNQAPLVHVRVHAFIWHKKCFPKPPVLQSNQAQPLPSFEQVLDLKGFYRVMPKQDQKALIFSYSHRPGGVAYVASISDLEEQGRGHCHWPNQVCCPKLGLMSLGTAAAGAKWHQDELRNEITGAMEPVVRKLNKMEVARGYCWRRAKTGWLADESEAGQAALGNCVPTNAADSSMSQLVLELTRIQPDGLTPLEKWDQLIGSFPATVPETELVSAGEIKTGKHKPGS